MLPSHSNCHWDSCPLNGNLAREGDCSPKGAHGQPQSLTERSTQDASACDRTDILVVHQMSEFGVEASAGKMGLKPAYDVWRNDQVWPRLGCAVAPAEAVAGSEAYLCCGHSFWLREERLFVVVQDFKRRWTFVSDESGRPSDAPLMVEPVSRRQPCFPATGRHGWLARSPSWAEKCGGLSRTGETAFSGAMQPFEGGWLLL